MKAVVKFKGVQGEEKESLYADREWQRLEILTWPFQEKTTRQM